MVEEQISLHRRLRFGLHHTASVCILMYCCTRIQHVALPTIMFRVERTDASRQNPNATDTRRMSFRDPGVMLYQELHGFGQQL